MSKTNPWNDIKTPSEDLSVRQIKISKHLPLYWGKDSSGHCVFIYEMSKDGAEIFHKNGYTDLMVDGSPSPHQSDTTLRWLIDRLRS